MPSYHMEKIDARKLTPRELMEKRKIVIKLREKGMSNREVAKVVGISKPTTSLYYSRYKKEGKKRQKPKMRQSGGQMKQAVFRYPIPSKGMPK